MTKRILKYNDHPGRYGERKADEVQPYHLTAPLRDYIEGAIACAAIAVFVYLISLVWP